MPDAIAWSGLLSRAGLARRDEIESAHRVHAQLAEDVNAAAIALIVSRRVECKRGGDYIAQPLYARTILDFEATVLLAGSGFRTQSRGAARSLFETATYCVAACQDYPGLVEALDGAHQRFRKNVADGLRDLPETPPEVVARLEALSAELKPITEASKKSSLSIETIAFSVAKGLYTVLYRPLSQDAHVSATAMEVHANVGADGRLAFKVGADFSQYEDTILAGIAMMLMAANEYASRFGSGEDASMIEGLKRRYAELSEAGTSGTASPEEKRPRRDPPVEKKDGLIQAVLEPATLAIAVVAYLFIIALCRWSSLGPLLNSMTGFALSGSRLVCGLVVTLVLGLFVKPVVIYARTLSVLIPPDPRLADEWQRITEGDEGGSVLGPLERVLFFGSLWTQAYLLVGIWLAFKVATKWNAWSDVIAVPGELEGVDPLDYLTARRRWGSNMLMTSLIGTLSNIVAAGVGVAAGRFGFDAIRTL